MRSRTPDAEGLAFWDAELDHLSLQATDLFGDEVVAIALENAFIKLQIEHPDLAFSTLQAVLKAELRRLMRPH